MTATRLESSTVNVQRVTRRNARNGRAFRAPWLTLFTAYLCIHGLFGTFAILLAMPTQTNLLWHIRLYFFGDYDWTAPWAWADPTHYLWLCLTQVLTLAAGLLLWTCPTKAKRIVVAISIVLVLEATLSFFTSLGEWMTRGSLYPGWAVKSSFVLNHLAVGAVPIVALWFVHRVQALRRPAITLIAGYLIVVGAARTMAHVVLLFAEGSEGYPQLLRDSGWPTISSDLLFLVWRRGGFVLAATWLVCGLVLVMRPSRIVAVALAVLPTTLFNPLVVVLLLATGRLYLGGEFLSALSYLCGDAGRVAMALFFLLFAFRRIQRSKGLFPECGACGYNLTGNVSGRCPECGKKTDSVDSVE